MSSESRVPSSESLSRLEGERAGLAFRWAGDAATGVVERLRDGAAAGSVLLEQRGDVLFVAHLEVQLACRGYGLGSESARLLRAYAEGGAWRTLRAWAPPDLGLAVYFWSRMGLRPLHGEGPNGGIWFERALG